MFKRSASSLSQATSPVQTEVRQRLLERLHGLKFEPGCVLDLGCGAGESTRALAERYPDARVIAMDRSLEQLDQARGQQGRWRKRFERVAGDAQQIPLAQGSADLLFSSLMLPLCRDLPALLNGFRRVLKPGGLMLFSTFGPDSLSELRAGLSEVDQPHLTHVFSDVQTVGNALMRAGFAEPVLDTDWFTSHYRRSVDLLRELRVMDPSLWLEGNRNILRSYRADRAATEPFTAHWEAVYASAWAPEDGAPIRDFDGGEVATVSIESIGRRQR
ncbi:MAG: methyltransferase domain-containing protein [Pseudomonadota bacterium]